MLAGLPAEQPAEPGLGALGRPWTTAIFKQPVEGPVAAAPDGLAGDRPADLERHGGPERALLAYPVDHYDFWRRELGRDDLSPGAFGENLALAGCDERSACIGDLLRIGGAQLRITQPRQPGWKIARRWRDIGLPKRMAAARRTGWYLRVECPGEIAAGASVELLSRPCPEWPVELALAVLYDPLPHRNLARPLYECAYLGSAWRAKLAVRHRELRDPS